MKKPSEIKGILVHESKTFYYLETGKLKVSNPLDRIQKVLLAKDILTYTGSREDVTEEKIKSITLLEAREKGYKIEVLYLNNHIKATSESPSQEVQSIKWGSKRDKVS